MVLNHFQVVPEWAVFWGGLPHSPIFKVLRLEIASQLIQWMIIIIIHHSIYP